MRRLLTSGCYGPLGGLVRVNGQLELSEYERVSVGARPQIRKVLGGLGMAFRVRIRADLTHDRRVHSSEKSVTVCVPGIGDVTITGQHPEKPIGESNRIVLSCGPFETEETASEAGIRLKTILRRFSLCDRLPLEMGALPPGPVITDAGLKHFETQFGEPLERDERGVLIYEDRGVKRFLGAEMELTVGVPLERMTLFMESDHHLVPKLSEEIEIAAELLTLASFESSPTSTFLVRIMALESLVKRQKRSPEVQDKLEELMDQIRSTELPEKDSIVSAIGGLKMESIQGALRRLVGAMLDGRQYGGMPAIKFIGFCYGLRSELVHGASLAELRDRIIQATGELDRLATDLMLGVIEQTA